MKEKKLIVIGGPTASGKTALAIQKALELKTEIISFDSRQFYQEMSIGTAKPTEEELAKVKHHFIGNISISEEWNAAVFEKHALVKLDELFLKYDSVVAVGGSGLYLNALLYGFDDLPDKDEVLRAELQLELEEKGIESLQNKIKVIDPVYFEKGEIKNPNRLMRAIEVSLLAGKPYSSLRTETSASRHFTHQIYMIDHPREKLYERINLRVDEMIQNGLVEEVKSLLPFRNHNALQTVGYKEIFEFLDGKCSLEEAIEKVKQNTRRYAKRQITWFKNQYEVELYFEN